MVLLLLLLLVAIGAGKCAIFTQQLFDAFFRTKWRGDKRERRGKKVRRRTNKCDLINASHHKEHVLIKHYLRYAAHTMTSDNNNNSINGAFSLGQRMDGSWKKVKLWRIILFVYGILVQFSRNPRVLKRNNNDEKKRERFRSFVFGSGGELII